MANLPPAITIADSPVRENNQALTITLILKPRGFGRYQLRGRHRHFDITTRTGRGAVFTWLPLLVPRGRTGAARASKWHRFASWLRWRQAAPARVADQWHLCTGDTAGWTCNFSTRRGRTHSGLLPSWQAKLPPSFGQSEPHQRCSFGFVTQVTRSRHKGGA